MYDAIAYVHLQDNLPKCTWHSLRKTREQWDGDIYLICPQREADYEANREYNIKVVSREGIDSVIIKDYEKYTFFPSMYPAWNGFWDNACKRFVYLNALMDHYKIDSLVHIENDVIVYLPLSQMVDSMRKVYGGRIVFAPHEPEALNCGFTYIGSREALKTFCVAIIGYFKRGVKWFNEKYPKQPIINETLFAYNFWAENSDIVGLFPSLPTDQNANALGFLIDPDSWGRWVDGVRYNPGTRYAAERHYIGKKIIDGVYDVHFSYIGRKIKTPYAYNKIDRTSFPIATLHFNSKEPEKWI